MADVHADKVKTMVQDVMTALAHNYGSVVEKERKELSRYFDTANITGNDRAKYMANFSSGTVQASLQGLLAVATEALRISVEEQVTIATAGKINAEKDLTGAEKAKIDYEVLNLLPKQGLILDEERNLTASQATTEGAKQAHMNAEVSKLGQETSLLTAQASNEAKKGTVGGIIEQQAELYKQQALSFKGHNLAKAGDSIAQVMGMIVAEGALPDPTFVSAHSAIMNQLYMLSTGNTIYYTAVK